MTTLQILAPYLPYRIDCEYLTSTGRPMRRRLVGLDEEDEDGVVALSNRTYINMDECTPILRSFSSLCTPLEDGTVPAVEVAKLANGLGVDEYDWSKAFAHGTNPEGTQTIDVFVGDADSGDWCVANIDCDWNVEIDGSMAYGQIAIINYLRSKHFAVGLSADQYIQKQA